MCRSFLEHLLQRSFRDGAAAQAGNDRVAGNARIFDGNHDVAAQYAARTHSKGAFEHNHCLGAFKRFAHHFNWERTEALDANNTNLEVCLFTQFVDSVLDRAQARTHSDDTNVGILAAVGMNQTARAATEHFLEFCGYLRDKLERLTLLDVREVTHFGKGLGTNHGADGDRITRVELLTGRIRR